MPAYNPQKITIIAFLRAYPPHTGGAQKIARDLYAHLDPQKYAIHILLDKKLSPCKKPFVDGPLNIHPVAFPKTFTKILSRRFAVSFLRSFGFKRILNKINYKNAILHFHWFEDIEAFHIAPGIFKAKVVYTCHNTVAAQRIIKKRERSQKTAKHLSAITMLCPVSYTIQNIIENIPQCPALKTIQNGVAMQPNHLSRKKFDSTIEYLYAGRLIPHKKVHLLIEAMQILIHQYTKQVHLTIAGHGLPEYEQKLKQQITNYKLEAYVSLVGQTDVAPLYKKCHVYISASEIEGMPLAPMEAMSYGLVPVLSDIDPHKELLHSYDVSCLFPKGNATALAQTLASLNPAALQTLSAQALQLQHSQFSSQRMEKAYDVLFTELSTIFK